MFYEKWDVLLVDDERDVLLLSKLAMRNFEVYGLPLAIHTVGSKEEAIELLDSKRNFLPRLSMALIDVVMESNTAGLELCHTIREERGNKLTQLYIRTGQPGIAPERDVIDRYDISGYLTKAEATEDKLYSIVKSGIRQHLWAKWSLWLAISFRDMVETAVSPTKIQEGMQRFFEQFHGHPQRLPPDSAAQYGHLIVADHQVGLRRWTETEAGALSETLDQQIGTPLSLHGDKHVIDAHGNQLLKAVVPGTDTAVYWLFRSSLTLPDYIITMAHQVLTGWGMVWQRQTTN